MEKLDFSGISTGKLKNAIRRFDENGSACNSIFCTSDRCPFRDYNNGSYCRNISEADIHLKAFKEELERREKDMNTMPELKAGMIVEYMCEKRFMIVLPSGDDIAFFSPTGTRYQSLSKDSSKIQLESVYCNILSIHSQRTGCEFSSFFNMPKDSLFGGDVFNSLHFDDVWEKTDRVGFLNRREKIEELQEKMDAISKEMEELKGWNA